ncbi:P-loop containing nucleoside triphosphate hydrolase protein [Parathielavia appendiculata]|uniref:P-loop containing nucleoside triphosphate hydrolase protein n=1 Tax=Parathielavia appendiculata TaxID=2587402 RepID=A0AAN6U3F9_9PEZI|nr:P-loop containing nucleoside triphosphate hydrolase protein [Parathielavia appendiculata]
MAAPNAPLQTRMVDDKSPICIPFILSRLAEYRAQQDGETHPRPFIVGLNGVQGVGKTTLVRALAETLQEREGLPTLVVSIDDFYLTHADQLALAAAHPDNALVQYRGEPGTHDLSLLTQFLTSLTTNPTKLTPIPQYDKSAFSGQGDRLPPSTWPTTDPTNPPQVLILEGWCVGFRPLSPPLLVESKWKSAGSRTLHNHKLDHLLFINSKLEDYDRVINSALDAFIHIDAEDTEYVYAWRAEQEAQLRRERGAGMSEEQVIKFVDAYYPAYELFAEGVRGGVFRGKEGRKGCQLRLVVGRDRTVKENMVI